MWVCAVGVLAVGAQAWAQTEPVETREFVFTDMNIDGARQGPPGDVFTSRGDSVFESLIDLRVSFVDKIVESADEVVF